MTRAEALAAAEAMVSKMGTNSRGYNDNPFEARVSAVLRLAAFLMEGETDAA